MTDRPIIFSALMVRALLDGRKNMTRRLASTLWKKAVVGDRLYVREAWGHEAPDLDACRRGHESDGISYGPYYMADANWADNHTLKKRSSIHMPRWASRLTLTVTEVRIEALHDISEGDAKAEGAEPVICGRDSWSTPIRSHRTGFVRLWNQIHGDKAWLDNPHVVVLRFTVERRNIDD